MGWLGAQGHSARDMVPMMRRWQQTGLGCEMWATSCLVPRSSNRSLSINCRVCAIRLLGLAVLGEEGTGSWRVVLGPGVQERALECAHSHSNTAWSFLGTPCPFCAWLPVVPESGLVCYVTGTWFSLLFTLLFLDPGCAQEGDWLAGRTLQPETCWSKSQSTQPPPLWALNGAEGGSSMGGVDLSTPGCWGPC